MRNQSILENLRRDYHKKICDQILGYRTEKVQAKVKAKPGKIITQEISKRLLSNADSKDPAGVDFAARMAELIGMPLCAEPPRGQTAGSLFTKFTCEFVEAVSEHLLHVRPGRWKFTTRTGLLGIAAFEQYDHLNELAKLIKNDRKLAATLGGDYFIKPDIVVCREALTDSEINGTQKLITGKRAPKYTNLRSSNLASGTLLLHASVSCKWTIRSDRSQNTRSEALNLIRSRKGRTPHIVAVTMEPGPSRLASIVLGTGDIDCTYHAALHELMEGASKSSCVDAATMLQVMVEGKRLKDISDLPFDLAI